MLDFRTQILPYLNVNENGLPIDQALYHAGYKKSKEISQEIKDVFSDNYSPYLDKNRPNEQTNHKIYRREIYRNVVGMFRTKVLGMYDTIYQNDNFNIVFDKKSNGNELEEYTEKEMFANNSLPEWFFTEWAKFSVDDPNACVAPTLENFATNDTEYQSPKLMCVGSEGVIYHSETFCVLRGEEKTYIKVNNTKEKIGRNLYFYDKDSFVICRQRERATTDTKETNYIWEIIGQVEPIRHNYRKMPVVKIGRILGEKIDGEVQLYKSEVSDALPHLKGIEFRASDKEIELIHHVHSIPWMAVQERQCNAVGCKNGFVDFETNNIDNPIGKRPCKSCNGTGIPVNGLTQILWVIKDDGGIENSNTKIPTSAPGGYFARPIEALNALSAEVLSEWKNAWNTINAMWLMESPQETSGVSKSYDRQEYERRLAAISLHIWKHLDLYYEWIGAIRFSKSDNWKELLPQVNVPLDSFNLITQGEALEEYSKAIKDGMSGDIVIRLAIIYSDKRFGVNSESSKKLRLIAKFDPYLSINGNNKTEILTNKLFNDFKIFGIEEPNLLKETIRKAYLSINLDSILSELISKEKGFLQKEFDYQKGLIDAELEKYLPTKISEDIFKTIKQEPLTDVVGQGSLN